MNIEGFGHDTWWIVLIKVLAVFVFLMVMTILAIWFERRVVGRMQVRPGPNRNGPFGLLQSLADGLKLIFKEEIIPRTADKVVYFIAPIISATCAFTAFAVVPMGPRVAMFGQHTMLQVTDVPVAVLIMLACSSIAVYGVVLAGWSSGTPYPLLGALRSSAQMISYEVSMGLSIVAVFMTAGSMSTSQIVAAQASGEKANIPFLDVQVHLPGWYAILLLPSFFIYFVSAVGETNRAPFDLPEAESELVAGYNTEYSSLKFMMFYLAEYINMITVSALSTTLFLGGWRAPWPVSLWSGANSGYWPLLWFTAKVVLFLFVFVWLRGTLPRLRYDQFMRFGWKVLTPVSLVWIVALAGIKTLQHEHIADSKRIMIVCGVAVVVLLVLLLWPTAKPDGAPVADGSAPVPGTPADGMGGRQALIANGRVGGAEGYPLPPLDLRVPQNPRLAAVERPVPVATVPATDEEV